MSSTRPPLLPLIPIAAALFPVNAAMLMISPVWGGLARELGYSEVLAGAIIAATPLTWMLASPVVGRLADRFGRHRFIWVGVMLGWAAQVLFSAVLAAGLSGHLSTTVVMVGTFAARGLLGIAGGAVTVACFALTADLTTPQQRTAATATLGGVVGLGALGGPALAAASSGLGEYPLLIAMAAVPVLGVPGLFFLPDPPLEPTSARTRLGPLAPRLRAILAVVLAGSSALAAADLLLGFVFADLTGQGLEVSGPLAGITLLLAGVAVVVVQLILARFPVGPRVLLSVGPLLAAVCFVAVGLTEQVGVVMALGAGAGVGLGLSMTGWTSGTSLAVNEHEQGQAAGQVQVVSSVAYMIAPLVAGAAYGVWPALPWLLLLPLLVGASVLAMLSRGIRRVQGRHVGAGAIPPEASP